MNEEHPSVPRSMLMANRALAVLLSNASVALRRGANPMDIADLLLQGARELDEANARLQALIDETTSTLQKAAEIRQSITDLPAKRKG